jgi:hypothetical protein
VSYQPGEPTAYEREMYGHLLDAAEERERQAREAAEFVKHPTMKGAVKLMTMAQFQAEQAAKVTGSQHDGSCLPGLANRDTGGFAASKTANLLQTAGSGDAGSIPADSTTFHKEDAHEVAKGDDRQKASGQEIPAGYIPPSSVLIAQAIIRHAEGGRT